MATKRLLAGDLVKAINDLIEYQKITLSHADHYYVEVDLGNGDIMVGRTDDNTEGGEFTPDLWVPTQGSKVGQPIRWETEW